MKAESVAVKTGEKDKPDYKEATFEWNHPENLAEALETIGEEKVFKLVLAQHKTNFVNEKRLELRGKETGVRAYGRAVVDAIAKAKESGNAELIAQLEALLGTPIAS